MNVPTNLVTEAMLHCPLVHSTCVFQPKGHRDIAKGVVWGSERSGQLVRLPHLDLVVSRVCIEKTQKLRASRRVNDLVNARQSKRIFGSRFVQDGVINAHS